MTRLVQLAPAAAQASSTGNLRWLSKLAGRSYGPPPHRLPRRTLPPLFMGSFPRSNSRWCTSGPPT